MKTIVLIIILCGLSVCTMAQKDFQFRKFEKFNSNKYWEKDSLGVFPISPLLKTDKKLSRNNFLSGTQKSHLYMKYSYTMPIAKPGRDCWNMPVFVPDSTVNYAIKDKRIQFSAP